MRVKKTRGEKITVAAGSAFYAQMRDVFVEVRVKKPALNVKAWVGLIIWYNIADIEMIEVWKA